MRLKADQATLVAMINARFESQDARLPATSARNEISSTNGGNMTHQIARRLSHRTALLSTAALFVLAGLDAAPAAAQATPGTDAQNQSDIVVTGSRLRRTDLTAPSPTTVIGEADIKLSGNATIESTLNEFPQLAAGTNSSVNNGGGSGVLTANLRGLGATRTLTLVNGRRFIPANSDGSVDLTSIPDALVEKVEIITGGASAVYGSDAIAGAVNFKLKRNFEGIEAAYQRGSTFRGDGEQQKLDVTVGANTGERGNVVLSVSYTKRGDVQQQNRAFSRVGLDTVNGVLVPGGSGNIPGTRIALSASQRALLNGVDLAGSGACTNLSGIRFGEAGAALPYCNPQSLFNAQAGNYLLRPLKRIQVTALAHHELSDTIEAFGEAFYMNNQNSYQQAPDSFQPVTPGAGAQTLLVPNYATNPILLPAVRQFFVNNRALFDPDGDGTATVVGAGRRANELGYRNYSYERASLGLTGGLRGTVDILGSKPWAWEAFYQYQRTRTDQKASGVVNQSRLAQALNATTNAQGQIVCVDASRNCVPVSIFGLDTISTAAGAFLTPDRDDSERFDRQVAGASLSGSLFDLPAGSVDVALGAEYRKDKYRYTASPGDLANEYGAASLRSAGGEYDLKELFGEIRIPLLTGKPFFDTLALEGAARYSDYNTIGGVFTWKTGAEWAPVDWVRFRGAYNVAIRAPTLNELYSPSSQTFSNGTDPCAASAHPSVGQQQLCIAQGVNASSLPTFAQASNGVTVSIGGNPNLKEEKSKTYTIGAVISPPFVRGLNLTVDYFNVVVDDAIISINADQTLGDCFATLDQNSATCRSISRLANGQISVVETNLNNVGQLRANGIDAQADYSLELPDAVALGETARLSLQAIASWLFERSIKAPNRPSLDCAGIMGGGCGGGTGNYLIPDFKLNLSGTYLSGPLTFRAQGRMIGDFKLNPTVSSPVTHIKQQWYFDASTSIAIGKKFELFGGIDNLFDKKPPIMGTALAGDANTDPSLFDVIGRRFFAGVRLRY